jgi:serine/threonine protein phosphatase PrpC
MKLVAGSATDTGLVRSNNEDSFLVDDEHVLYAIADGMGGHRGGEVASRTAIEALRAGISRGQPVNDAIVQANTAVIERAAGDHELSGMGTTMTAAVVAGGRQLLIGHVGDSRAYLLHDGAMRRITDDHSLVEELVREGRLTPEQAEAHPQRAIVTRALGVDADVQVDLYTVEVAAGDRVLLCSDGLTTMVRDRDVERLLRAETDPQRTAEMLVEEANRAGGEDNTSVVVIDVLEVDAASLPDPDLLAPPVAAVASGPRLMTPAPEPEPAPVPRARHRESFGRRIWGALLLFVPLLLVLAIAFAGVGWYARRSYYVGFANGSANAPVVIFKGVPGGVLGWDPTVQQETQLTADQLSQIDHDRVAGGAARGSLSDAQRFVTRLKSDVTATSTTTTPTTATTLPHPKRTTATTKPRVASTTRP